MRGIVRNLVTRILIVGGGSAGWMTVAHLSKAYGYKIKISPIESFTIPKIGVVEVTIPNLQKVLAMRGISTLISSPITSGISR
ncbi:tryptophan 7-halogenase [Burkholderia sp. LFS061]|uniref:tryptophan 7-halogenase n=1 Tax=Burkholderia sp. LFS061 TaxID=3229885 RepID=UPI003A8033CA